MNAINNKRQRPESWGLPFWFSQTKGYNDIILGNADNSEDMNTRLNIAEQ